MVTRAGVTTALTVLMAVSAIPYPTTDIVLAAPAALDASFRDLPSTVRAGDSLSVQVGVPSCATCDGAITYRDGAVQKLDSLTENNGRCRWNLIVLSNARRGSADVTVNVNKDSDQATLEASLDVTRRGDDVNATFHDLPGIVQRNDNVDLRVDVDDGAGAWAPSSTTTAAPRPSPPRSSSAIAAAGRSPFRQTPPTARPAWSSG